jgi:hypothetical protein
MRIAVPLIGLLAAGAALALVVFAPGVLFFDDTPIGASASAPPASSEVAQVTAPRIAVRPARGTAPTTGSTGVEGPGSAGSASVAASHSGGVASAIAGKSRGPLARRGATAGGTPISPPVSTPGKVQESHGKAKGHAKAKHHGKAKGHAKHGKAKGHAKKSGRVAFTPRRGAKPGHVHHPRAQGHARGRARAHARPRR